MLILLLAWTLFRTEPAAVAVTPPVVTPVPESRYASGCHVPPDSHFERDLLAASLEFGIRPEWLAVTVWTESGCNPYARGSSGEIGLVQIHPRWWRKALATAGIHDLWNPHENLRAGAYALSRLAHHGPREMFRRYNGKGPRAQRYADRQLALLEAP
jgi:hypothetical protein